MSISVIILTKNEEKNIVDCLESVSWCTERIVIDDNSDDNTVELAKKNGAQVYSRELNDDFSKQRNFGLSKAKSDWVFFVDADERISQTLASEISNFLLSKVEKQIPDGFYIQRKDFMWGGELKHGETGNIKLVRLAKKETGEWAGRVHEEWRIKGKVSELKNPILHYPHQTIKEFLNEINHYTDLRAKELYSQNIKSNWKTILLYPKAKFLQNYIFRLGFLDGNRGFVFAMLMSLHSFLVRGKLWLLWQKK